MFYMSENVVNDDYENIQIKHYFRTQNRTQNLDVLFVKFYSRNNCTKMF